LTPRINILMKEPQKNKDVLKKKTKSAGWKRYQYALENKENLEKALEKIEKAEKALEDNKIITRDEPKLLAGSKKQKQMIR